MGTPTTAHVVPHSTFNILLLPCHRALSMPACVHATQVGARLIAENRPSLATDIVSTTLSNLHKVTQGWKLGGNQVEAR
jgi:hypothetical protein